MHSVKKEVDKLSVESDGNGWSAKAYLYCAEIKCPQTGWMVPLIPKLIISQGYRVIAKLIPDEKNKCYEIKICSNVTKSELSEAEKGTVRSDGKGQDSYIVHIVNGKEYRTKISTLRGDFKKEDGSSTNRLRLWEKNDFKPRSDDIFQERLYAIQWMRPKKKGKDDDYEFRSVTEEDLKREKIVEDFISKNLADWQEKGWIPDMRIEPGDETERLYKERGWTHWHHLFHPRQLLIAGLYNKADDAKTKIGFCQLLNYGSRLCYWATSGVRLSKDGKGKQVGGASNSGVPTFYNQALNTVFNFCVRASDDLLKPTKPSYKHFELPNTVRFVATHPAHHIDKENDIYLTDPPYGDAVKYEEILEFFIAWLKKNPPKEFTDWIWDSRRALAIKGEGEEFRQGMVAAYKRMTEKMPYNGIQIIMFTHQSGSLWADMANIVWASGLQVTAAWYIATETDSALRKGSYVKGTVLLVLRKRKGTLKSSRDDLAWEIKKEVEDQVNSLTGLNQEAKGLYRDENLFEDADLQMAGYAAALRVLTKYIIINGKDMPSEAIRPRIKGQKTFVDELIEFAVGVANQCLVPYGLKKNHWEKLTPVERFYLKMTEMESRGAKTLDNYQNFAKAFKVKNLKPLMASEKANSARLKGAIEFGKTEMSESSEFFGTVLRAILYAIMELVNDNDSHEVLNHLSFNVQNFYDSIQRECIVDLANYLAQKLSDLRPEESRAANILGELIKNQQI